MSALEKLQAFVNLAQPRLGACVLDATDDFFAEKENLIKPDVPVFVADKFTDRGKWMDGWESRRKREPGHDHCVLRICRGKIFGVDIDTSFFTGNFPQSASLQACDTAGDPDDATEWVSIVQQSPLKGDSHNIFMVHSDAKWSHLKLHIYPDGGVARLRVYGEVYKDWSQVASSEVVDLAAVINGGTAVACSDMHFGSMWNLLSPGRAVNMGDGWETGRRRGAGHDWAIIRLGRSGIVQSIEIDTLHFKGNFPAACAVRSIFAPQASVDQLADSKLEWDTLLERAAMRPDVNHVFNEQLLHTEKVSHVMLEMHPDGGVGRLRIRGSATT